MAIKKVLVTMVCSIMEHMHGGRLSMDIGQPSLSLIGVDGNIEEILNYFGDSTKLQQLDIDTQQHLIWYNALVTSIQHSQ